MRYAVIVSTRNRALLIPERMLNLQRGVIYRRNWPHCFAMACLCISRRSLESSSHNTKTSFSHALRPTRKSGTSVHLGTSTCSWRFLSIRSPQLCSPCFQRWIPRIRKRSCLGLSRWREVHVVDVDPSSRRRHGLLSRSHSRDLRQRIHTCPQSFER